MTERTKIYVELLNEGIEVWRPVEALHLKDDIYQITSIKDDPDEEWKFVSGEIVHCKSRVFSDGTEAITAYGIVSKTKLL